MRDLVVFKNNPVLTRKVQLSKFNTIVELYNDWLSVGPEDITMHDLINIMYQSNVNEMQEQGDAYLDAIVLMDTPADKKAQNTSKMRFNLKGEGMSFAKVDTRYAGNNQNVITKLKFEKYAFVSTFEDFVGYYKTIQQESMKRWNNVLKTSYGDPVALLTHIDSLTPEQTNTLLEVIKTRLKPTVDYYIGNDGVITIGNHTALRFVVDGENNQSLINEDFIREWELATTEDEKFDVITNAFDKPVADFALLAQQNNFKIGEKTKAISSKVFREPVVIPIIPIKDSLAVSSIDVNNIDELEAHFKSVYGDVSKYYWEKTQNIKNNDSISDTDKRGLRSVINKEKAANFAEIRKIKNAVYEKIGFDLADNDIIKYLVYTHFVFNESISQITRNGVLSYPNLTDYVKRAAGPKAPGDVMITHKISDVRKVGLLEYGRMILLNDIPGYNYLFDNKKVKDLWSNGLIPINPISHRLAMRSAGGVDGKVGFGSLKWVDYFYDILRDNGKYLKASFMPLNERHFEDDPLFHDMVQMMMGPTIWNKFMEIYDSYDGVVEQYNKSLDEVTQWVEDNGLQSEMVDMVGHTSTVKYGNEKTMDYLKVDLNEEDGPNNIAIDQRWNDGTLDSYMKSVSIDFSKMRIQQVVSKDAQEPYKPLALQISYIMGLGEYNAGLIEEYNLLLSKFMEHGRNVLIDKASTPKAFRDYIKDSINRNLMSNKQGGAYINDMITDTSLQLYRRKALSTLLSGMDRYVKPTLPGIDSPQAPDFIQYAYDPAKPGVLYRPKDIVNHGIADTTEKRRIQPMRVLKTFADGTYGEYTDKKELLDNIALLKSGKKIDHGIKIIPGELIMQFPFQEKFGINKSMTLQDVMVLNFNGMTKSLYESGEQRAKDGAMTYNDYYNTFTDPNIGLFNGMSYDEIINTLPEDNVLRNTIRYWVTRSQIGDTTKYEETQRLEKNRELLISNIASYYKSINDAFDTFVVRIPTALGSSGGMYRIVAFDNNSSNTVYTSAEKSLLDGSDYDIDALQVYFNKIRHYEGMQEGYFNDDMEEIRQEGIEGLSEKDIETKKIYKSQQRLMFDFYRRFFSDPLNLDYQLEVTSTDTVTAAAEAIPKSNKIGNSLGTTLLETESGKANKTIIGHEASAENAMVRIAHLPLKLRKAVKGQFIDKSMLSFFDDNIMKKAVAFASELINSGTDGLKLGNPLGRLNIDKDTSPIITGMMVSGMEQTDAYKMISTNPYIQEARTIINSSHNLTKSDRLNAKGKYKDKIWNALNTIHGRLQSQIEDPNIDGATKDLLEKDIEDVKKFIKFAHIGEVMRRLVTVSSIQRDTGSTDFDLNNLKRNIELMLGMPTKVFLEKIIDIADYGSKSITDQYYNKVSKENDELKIRELLDLAWVTANNPLLTEIVYLVDTLEEKIKESFVVDQYFNGGQVLLEKLNKNNWDNEDLLNSYKTGVDKHITGRFLNTIDKFNMDTYKKNSKQVYRYENFDFKNISHRVDFALLFPDYIRRLKNYYGNIANFNKFINGLEVRPTIDNYELIAFDDINHLTSGEKAKLLAAFESLPLEIQKTIGLYQILVYGNTVGRGSFNDIIRNPYKKALSRFYDGYVIDDATDVLLEELIFTENLGEQNSSLKGSQYYTESNQKTGRKYTYKIVDGKKVYRYSPMWDMVNTYGDYNQVSDYKPSMAMPTDDIINLEFTATDDPLEITGRSKFVKRNTRTGEITVIKTGGWNGIYRKIPEGQKKYDHWMIKDDDGKGDTVETINGIRVNVSSGEGNTIKVSKLEGNQRIGDVINRTEVKMATDGLMTQRTIDRTTKVTSLYSSIIKNETSAMTNETLDIMLNKINIAFPNIQFVKTFTNDPENLYPDLIAYVHEGKVWINSDRVLIDTPLHEVSHIFLLVAKQTDLNLYRTLINASKSFLEAYPDIASLFRNDSMSDEMFLQELAARMMGWSTNEEIVKQLHSVRANNIEARSPGIFDSIINVLRTFYKFISDTIKGLFGIDSDVDFSGMDIFQVGQTINDMINRGEVVSIITPSELLTLQQLQQSSDMNISPLAQIVINSDQMADTVLNLKNATPFDKMTPDEQVNHLADSIEADNHYPDASTFGESMDLSQFSGDREGLKKFIRDNKLTKKLSNSKQNLQDNVIEYSNVKKGDTASIDSIFGVNEKTEISNYSEATISLFHRTIEWNPNHKLYNYKDFKEAYPNIAIDPYFETLDVTFNVEYKDTGQMIVSLYMIDNKPQGGTFQDVEVANIGVGFNISKKEASLNGITLKNTTADLNSLHLALLANDMMINNASVQINNMGSISIFPTGISQYFQNYYKVIKNILALGKNEGFMKNIPDSLKGYFNGNKQFRKADVKYEHLFMSILDQVKDSEFLVKARYIRDEYLQATLATKRTHMGYVLKELQKIVHKSSGDMWMMNTIKDAIKAIDSIYVPVSQMNTEDNMRNIETLTSSGYDIGNEFHQSVMTMIEETEHRVANEFLDFREKKYATFKWLEKNGHSIIGNKYKDLIVTQKANYEGKDVDVKMGHILWTKDDKLDPLFAYLARERGLSDELLSKGREIVEMITETLVDNQYHFLEHEGNLYRKNKKTKIREKITKDDVRKMLFEEYGYKKGVIPVMGSTTMDLINSGKIGQAIAKLTKQSMDQFNIYEEVYRDKETMKVDKMPDLFKEQMMAFPDRRTKYGTTDHLKALGLYMNSNGILEVRNKDDYKKNQGTTQDLEMLVDYFKMSTIRKSHFENYALPYINQIKIMLNDIQMNKGVNVSNTIKDIEMTVERNIYGTPKVTELMVLKAFDILPFLQGGSSIVGSMVMALNTNVAIMSGGINAIRTWSDTLARSFDPDHYSIKHMTQASAIFFKDIPKISQLSRDMHLINADTTSLIGHYFNRVTKKGYVDPQFFMVGNWATDFYARTNIMIATMLKDGSYDAYSYDKASGRIKYDMDKDNLYKNYKTDPIVKARYDHVKSELVLDGRMKETDEKLTWGYIKKEMTTIKVDGDRLVGGYTNAAKSNLNNYLVGRMYLMFKNYLTMAAQDAIHKGEDLENSGKLKIVKKGEIYVAEWERRYIEGYLTTMLVDLKTIAMTGSIEHLMKIKPHQKENYARLLSRIAMFAVMYALYNGFVDRDKDKEDDDNLIMENRLVKNWSYMMHSIFVLPQLWESVRNPSAFLDILTRWFQIWGKKWHNIDAKDIVPTSAWSLYEPFSDESPAERRSRKIKDGIKWVKENEEEND